MKKQIQLRFSPDIETHAACFKEVFEKYDFQESYRILKSYENSLFEEMWIILRKDHEEKNGFNPDEVEVYPDAFTAFMIEAYKHIEKIIDFYEKIFSFMKKNTLFSQDFLLCDYVDELRQSFYNNLKNMVEDSGIKNCILSLQEVQQRYYRWLAKCSGQIVAAVGIGAVGLYAVPFFLATGASMAYTMGAYAVANSVTSSVSTVVCNAMDGKDNQALLDNVPRAMFLGAVSGAVCGGISSSLSHVTTSTTAITSAEKKLTLLNMKIKAADTVANSTEAGVKLASVSATMFSKAPHAMHLHHHALQHSEKAQIVLQKLHEKMSVKI